MSWLFPCHALEAYKVDSTLTCISLSFAFGLEVLAKPSWFDLVESLLVSSSNVASVLHASSRLYVEVRSSIVSSLKAIKELRVIPFWFYCLFCHGVGNAIRFYTGSVSNGEINP